MSKHIAIVHIPFEINDPAETDPSAEADEIVRDIMRHGYGDAHLDDVLDTDPETANPKYIFPIFSRKELECGHGDDFRCVFTLRDIGKFQYCVESVDLQMSGCYSDDPQISIGGIGGELILDCPRNSDGSKNIEQLCRDWVGRWHREFVGKTEESVLGMFYIIKQVIAEGQFTAE